MAKMRTMKLQQPNFTRYFVTLPLDFIKELKWIKGQELRVEIKNNILIIKKKVN